MRRKYCNAVRSLFRTLVMVGIISLFVAPAIVAQADEVSDLQAAIKQQQQIIEDLQKRIEAIEAQKSAQAKPVASEKQVFAPATVAGNPSGMEYKLYGRADAGFVHNASKDNKGQDVTTDVLRQGGQMTSRLGLTGVWVFNEQYKAIWAAEAGIDLLKGQVGGFGAQQVQNDTSNTILMNRGITAGLATRDYGSFEFGVMYMAPFWVMLGADNASDNNLGLSNTSGLWTVSRPEALGRYLKGPAVPDANSYMNANNNTVTTSVTNKSGTTSMSGANTGTALFYANAFRYRTPNFAGFAGELSYSNGQNASNMFGSRDDGRTFAGNVQYSSGPLWLGYAHMDYQQVADISFSTSASGNWVSRNQVTDIIGARYKWRDLTLGGSVTNFSVSNAGGYSALAYGLSGAYDITDKHRLEASVGIVSYQNAAADGAYCTYSTAGVPTCKNLALTGENPRSTSFALGYLYKLQPNIVLYTYFNRVNNNANALLGTINYYTTNAFNGAVVDEFQMGTFITF